MDNKEYALVLEGGGAKCAYEAGAIIALEKYGYSFNVISGASYGAFNGAMYITGGIDHLLSFYQNINLNKMFIDPGLVDIIEKHQTVQQSVLPEAIKYCLSSQIYMANREHIAAKYREKITNNIDVNIIKNSPIDFYCSVLRVNNNPITIGKLFKSFSNRNEIIELYKSHEIEGRIISKEMNPLDQFIVASANYPVHPPLEINGEYFLDGGIYDNSPYRHLLYKGYKKIIIVRTHTSEDRPLDIEADNKNIIIIEPKNYLGCTLSFTEENMQQLIKQGYEDAEEVLKKINE